MTLPSFGGAAMAASHESESTTCAFCGSLEKHAEPIATCAVCVMNIDAGHLPHIVRMDPDRGPAHFCSLACMDNFDFMETESDA